MGDVRLFVKPSTIHAMIELYSVFATDHPPARDYLMTKTYNILPPVSGYQWLPCCSSSRSASTAGGSARCLAHVIACFGFPVFGLPTFDLAPAASQTALEQVRVGMVVSEARWRVVSLPLPLLLIAL